MTNSSAQVTTKWKLVWSDEFNYEGLPDSTKWNYDVGGHGWGNNELQYYTYKTIANARAANGKLVIEAIKEKKENNINGSENQRSQCNRSVAFFMNIHQLSLTTNIKIEVEKRVYYFLSNK